MVPVLSPVRKTTRDPDSADATRIQSASTRVWSQFQTIKGGEEAVHFSSPAKPFSQLAQPTCSVIFLSAISEPPQVSSSTFYYSSSIPTHSYAFLVDLYVDTQEFDNECNALSRESSKGSSLFPDLPDSDLSDLSLWSQDNSSSIGSVSPPYAVSKLEAALYYSGVSGHNRVPPKLIYRTSKDVFVPPTGPEAYRRFMTLEPVFKHDQLGQNNLWATVRSKQGIKISSIDLVRFRWMEEDEDGEQTPYTTEVTIWVGVLPDTLTSEVAFNSANNILSMLQQHGITNLDIAYRESVYKPSTGPALFGHASDLDPLRHVIDPLTTSLGLPIAGFKTLNMQGTLGFYFKTGDNLYGVTARHVLFPDHEGNDDYIYKGGPRKNVVLMGTKAFKDLVKAIQAQIGTFNSTVDLVEQRIRTLTLRVQGEGEAAQKAAGELETSQKQLVDAKTAIVELKKLFVKVNNEWTKPVDRVVGHVIWSPGISVATAPHNYTLDVAVILLDKKKFLPNFKGNVLDLGTEIAAEKFINLMYPRVDAPSDFKYPEERQLKLQGMVSENDMRNPVTKDCNGDLCRYVIKRGLTTFTTIGRATGFESFVRQYFANGGKRDSVEAVIFPYDNDSGPFSRDGDSGSIIVDAHGQFFALLTGGTGKTDSSDITFGTPMHWLWQVIKARFPGATIDV
ncbi:hypothetical protein FRB99_001223 [Tulasnella sp. 403]|nr:hypothetical protein FRB99_001223 [Tulasnella sp. 403]